MDKKTQNKWAIFWVVLCLALVGMIGVNAALVDLDAYVTYAILDQNCEFPLANGSLVYIIGSSNAIMDPMVAFGTNLFAGSVTGDDDILGTVRIGDNVTSNGTFFTTVQYDSDQIKYVYIRFFDWQASVPVTGLVYWGTSTVFYIGPPTLGVSSVDFTSAGELCATNLNNFIAIPEPSSANLILLVAGMAWAMRSSMKRRIARSGVDRSEGDSK